MPRSYSSSTNATATRRPILGRAMAILSLPLTPISKARAARTLLLFKRRRASAARRFRHYSYAYVGEYQFSPSGSPLLLPRPPGLSAWRSAANKRRGSKARAVLASLFCCAGGGDGGLDLAVLDGLPPLPAPREDAPYGYEEAYAGEVEEPYEVEYDEEEEVDRRAERFIERFYEEMRMQETRRLLI